MRTRTIERTSIVPVPAELVWARAGTVDGINDELRPWLAMSAPRGIEELDLTTITAPRHLGRSWIRLFGIIPVDFDDITVAEVGPGLRFVERSRMFSAPRWQHERTVEPIDAHSCWVRDELVFEPRRGFGVVLPLIVAALFTHRHRRLRRATP